MQGVFLGAAAAQADECVESELLVVIDDDVGHVARASVDEHPVRLVAAGAEDGAAHGEDSCELGFVELELVVLDDAAKAVAEADNLHAIVAEGGFAHTTDGGVESRAVAARRENADAFGFCHVSRPI